MTTLQIGRPALTMGALQIGNARGVRLGGGGANPWYRNGSALANSLVAYWRLDEASGARADIVGANTLTDNNTVGSATGRVYPLAADFELDNSEYLSIADNAILSVGDIDFWTACWVTLESKTTSRTFVGHFDTNAQRSYLLHYNQPSDRIRFVVSPDGSSVGVGSASANTFGIPTIDTNYFVIAWHNSVADTVSISVNGGAVDSVEHTTGVFNSTVAFALGARYATGTPGEFMDGLIGPAMFGKNYIPTADDIAFLYNSGAGRT